MFYKATNLLPLQIMVFAVTKTEFFHMRNVKKVLIAFTQNELFWMTVPHKTLRNLNYTFFSTNCCFIILTIFLRSSLLNAQMQLYICVSAFLFSLEAITEIKPNTILSFLLETITVNTILLKVASDCFSP